MHPYLSLAAGMAEPETVSERLFYGLRMLAFGMAVVFSVLAIIWLVLVLFRLIFTAIEKKRANGGVSADHSEPSGSADLTSSSTPAAGSSDDGAVLAAITAAVALIYEEENANSGKTTGFRVVSFRKVGTPWAGNTSRDTARDARQ